MQIEQRPTNPGNYTLGRRGKRPSKIVIHVMDGTYEGTASWFRDPAATVSAHYGVASDGRVAQYVADENAAWHAGDWDTNLISLGVEHEGRPSTGPWVPTRAQLAASAELVANLCERWGIVPGPDTILAHSRINPKHNCPGPTWPWDSYLAMVVARNGNAHQPDPDANRTVRLFDPETNAQIGVGTLVGGSDKVYVKKP